MESLYEPLSIVCWIDDLGEFILSENTAKDRSETNKCSFFVYTQESVRKGDHEWFEMTNAFILHDLLWKVQKGHAANRGHR